MRELFSGLPGGFPGSADGYDKKFHYPIYSVEGLPQGRHTIRIEALGDGTVDSQDTYIILEKFRILKDGNPEPSTLLY